MKTIWSRIQLTIAAWLASGALVGAAPIINNFTPATGAPGTQVTINGSGFVGSQTFVQFGNDFAAITFLSANQIVATVPTNAVSAPITVSVVGGGVAATTPTNFWVAPRIDSFDATAAKGQTINISGANFIVGGTGVLFGGIPATMGSVPATTQITVTVPTNAVTGRLTVFTFAGTNVSTTNFVVSGSGPSITDFTPTNGPVGTDVTINGGNLLTVTNVTFNGARSPTVNVTAFTQIHAAVPTNATAGPIVVFTTTGAATSAAPFVVTGLKPIVSGFRPANGKSGDLVTIDGINFLFATNVTFNGTNAAGFGITSDTQITAVVPNNATTGPIAVLNAAGSGTSASNFSIGPHITSVTPFFGSPGTTVTISGDNVDAVTNVTFNGTNAFFTFTGLNQITATVPPDAHTGPVRLDAPGGSDVTSSNFLVTGVAPIITGFSPNSGTIGVTTVTINGVNFTFVTNVAFGGGASVNVVPPSDTTFNVVLPAGTVTGPITVRSPYGTNVSASLFYISAQFTNFAPTIGLPASKVSLFGANFTDANAVSFAGSNGPANAFFTNVSANQIQCFVPLDAVNGQITVTTPAGPITSTNNFTVQHTAPLSIAIAATNRYVIRWAGTLTNYRLEATTNLAAPIVWTNTAYSPLSNGGQFFVSNAVADSPKFFRIINP